MRLDELSVQQERNTASVSQLLTQNSGFTEQGKVLGRCKRFFYDPETASSSGASHVPSQLLNIPSPRGMRSRDSGLPHDTRNTVIFLKAYLPEMDHPQFSSRIDGIWHHLLADCLPGNIGFFHGTWKRCETRAAEFVNTTPRFTQGFGTLTPLKIILQELIVTLV